MLAIGLIVALAPGAHPGRGPVALGGPVLRRRTRRRGRPGASDDGWPMSRQGLAHFVLRIDHADRRTGATMPSLMIHGELGVADCWELAGALRRLEATGATLAVIDLQRVPLLDAAALAVLFRSVRRCAGEGRDICLVTAPGPTDRLVRTLPGVSVSTPLRRRYPRQRISHLLAPLGDAA